MAKFEPENEDMKCAPSKIYMEGSCFTLEHLIKMAQSYNRFHPHNQINIIPQKKYLVYELKARATECNDQLCWLNLKWVKNLNDPDILHNTFRPKGPQGRFKWLSTTDINDIMKQYEYKYTDFNFLGAVPYDFADIPPLNNFNCDDFTKYYSKLGMIINFDNHNQSGTHWVAVYANLKNNKIYYFDSYGSPPRKRIREFMEKLAKWCLNHNIDNTASADELFSGGNVSDKYRGKIDVQYSKCRHQYKNSECGVYAVNFILRLLNNESFDTICKKIISDDTINQFRKVYFRFK